MTDAIDGDRAVIEAARAALQRSEAAHREAAAVPGAPPEWAVDHGILAEHAAQYEQRLAHFSPALRMGTSGFDALWQGEEALRREAANWRALGATATESSWRSRFQASAGEADRAADEVRSLRDQLLYRDQATERQALSRQPGPEAER